MSPSNPVPVATPGSNAFTLNGQAGYLVVINNVETFVLKSQKKVFIEQACYGIHVHGMARAIYDASQSAEIKPTDSNHKFHVSKDGKTKEGLSVGMVALSTKRFENKLGDPVDYAAWKEEYKQMLKQEKWTFGEKYLGLLKGLKPEAHDLLLRSGQLESSALFEVKKRHQNWEEFSTFELQELQDEVMIEMAMQLYWTLALKAQWYSWMIGITIEC